MLLMVDLRRARSSSWRAERSSGSADLTHHFVLLSGTLAVAGLMIHILRTRVTRSGHASVGRSRTDLLTGLRERARDQRDPDQRDRPRGSTPIAWPCHRQPQRAQASSTRTTATWPATSSCAARPPARRLDRRIDTVGRTGAVEFAILLPETDEHTGFLLAEQILDQDPPDLPRARFRQRQHRRRGVPQARRDADALSSGDRLGGRTRRAWDRTVPWSTAPTSRARSRRGHPPRRRGTAQARAPCSASPRCSISATSATPATRWRSPATARLSPATSASPEQRIARLRLAGPCTTSARSASPTRSSTSPDRSRPRSGTRSAASRDGGADPRRQRAHRHPRGVLARHEQPDGHGYLRGISGDESRSSADPRRRRVLRRDDQRASLPAAKPPSEAIAELAATREASSTAL